MCEPGMTEPRIQQAFERACEVVATLTLLLILSPVILLLAAALALSDGFPIIYSQKRIGKNGRPFFIYKFRTMRTGPNQGLSITVANDRRITRVGSWLRRFKLDELPQLFNVLKGEMSLIGPRPEVPEYVQFDDALWRAVLRCRPGITDLASLAYRDEEQFLLPAVDPDAYYRTVLLPEKLRLNVAYQQSRSFPRDLHLLWLTARYSLFPWGFDRGRVLRSLGE
jgi:lipopolysaccharide/colanic/teichoic acid biosynthesis glycosyltransferase